MPPAPRSREPRSRRSGPDPPLGAAVSRGPLSRARRSPAPAGRDPIYREPPALARLFVYGFALVSPLLALSALLIPAEVADQVYDQARRVRQHEQALFERWRTPQYTLAEYLADP